MDDHLLFMVGSAFILGMIIGIVADEVLRKLAHRVVFGKKDNSNTVKRQE
jgi:hypothetical protein